MLFRSALLCLAVCAGSAWAAEEGRPRSFSLAAEHEPLTLRGELHGREALDFRFDAPAGTCLVARLRSRHGATSFKLLAPDGEAADCAHTREGPLWQGVLQEGGRYVLRVYLEREAARRSEEAEFRLRVVRLGAADCEALEPPAR